MAKVGVLLSGCGVQDGSEIHEAVLTLLALDEAGAEVVCMAPNKKQTRVVNHATGETVTETRNVLVESARIARGKIADLAKVRVDDFDAVILPGGFGAALNLCDFGMKHDQCSVDPGVAGFLLKMYEAGKPIGAMCIAPTILANLLGNKEVELTIGTDAGTAGAVSKMGAKHVNCPVEKIVVDERNRVVTTPAYMLAGSVKELRQGIEQLVGEVLKMAEKKTPAAAAVI